jgi:hypothetical protein
LGQVVDEQVRAIRTLSRELKKKMLTLDLTDDMLSWLVVTTSCCFSPAMSGGEMFPATPLLLLDDMVEDV